MTYQNPYQRPSQPGQPGQQGQRNQPSQNYQSGFPNTYSSPNFPAPADSPAPVRRGKPNTGDSHNYTRSGRIRTGITFAIGYLVVIWAVFLVNFFIFGDTLNYFGIRPLDLGGIWGIFFAPVLHGDLGHIIANSVPGAIFCFLIGLSGKKAWWEVTLIVGLVAGIGTWLLGGPGTLHIGASGLVYGWLTYLVVRGIFNQSLVQFALGVILGIAYSGLIWGVLPIQEGVSWQGHLFGAVGGVLAGMVITSDDTLAQLQRRARRR